MFKIITSLTMLAVGLLANAQVTEIRNVETFDKLDITEGVEVIFTQNEHFTVKAEATDGLGLSTLLTQTDNHTLRISCNGNLCESAKVYVSAPEMLSVKASHDAKVTIADRLTSAKFAVALSSGATFNGNVNVPGQTMLKARSGSVYNIRLETGSLAGSFSGGSKVNLSGHANTATIRTSDAALCHARNFKTGRVDVAANDNSSVLVGVANEINVEVNGQATARYFGFPEKTTVNPEAVTVNSGSTKSLVTQN